MVAGLAAAAVGALGAIGGSILDSSATSSANQQSFMNSVVLGIQQELFNKWNMDYADKYNTKYMNMEHDWNSEFLDRENQFNREMLDRQFEYNKYFTEHAHQAEVADLKAAGLNPILSANNGSSSSVGLPSSATASDHALGMSVPSTGAHSFQAQKVQAAQLLLQGIGVGSHANLENASSAKLREEAKTEAVRRENISTNTMLQSVQAARESVEGQLRSKDLSNYDEDRLHRLRNDLLHAQSAIISAQASQVSASANMMNANTRRAEHVFEKAQYENNPQVKWNKLHPSAASWTTGIGRWTGAFGNILGGNVGVGISPGRH